MLLPIKSRHALIAAAILFALTSTVWADPPGRVARLNYLSGQVSFRPASLDDWGTATVNYPLTTGDHLWTDRDARAEMHVGASVIRLAPETAFSFLNLDDDVVQTRIAEGSVDIHVREISGHDIYEIDTPNVSISLVRAGIYRIDVDPDGDFTRVVVRSGLADVKGSDSAFSVYAGDMAEVSGTDETSYDISAARRPDTWENWCRSRDEREDSRVALRYVPRDMIGYEDLDDNGTWDYVPDYGWGWRPTVVAYDWAPYRYGRWMWVAPWGWTWVDDARWGFAPFHYGRWAYCRSRWMWFPGHYAARPVWAPALVAFVGGNNWSFSFGFGTRPAVGWFPLAPGEAYYPGYRVSPWYIRNMNVACVKVTNINVTNINVTNINYVNRNIVGATTAVPRDTFVGAQAVQRVAVAVPRNAIERAPVVAHGVTVAPESRSVMGHIGAAVARPSASVMNRAVVARIAPPEQAARSNQVVTLGQARTRDAAAERPNAAGSERAMPGRRVDANASQRGEQAQPERPSAQPGQSWRGVPAQERTAPRANEERPAQRQEQASPRSRGEERQDNVGPRGFSPGANERPVQRDEQPSRGWQRQVPAQERPVQRDEQPARGWQRQAPAQDEKPAQRQDQAAPRSRSEERPAPAAQPNVRGGGDRAAERPAARAPERGKEQGKGNGNGNDNGKGKADNNRRGRGNQ